MSNVKNNINASQVIYLDLWKFRYLYKKARQVRKSFYAVFCNVQIYGIILVYSLYKIHVKQDIVYMYSMWGLICTQKWTKKPTHLGISWLTVQKLNIFRMLLGCYCKILISNGAHSIQSQMLLSSLKILSLSLLSRTAL